jgi:hypothetical protein
MRNKKRNFKLTIPKPCPQNWDAMTPTTAGRFCESCSKCVRDFTNFTDQELIDYFGKANTKTCGRFTEQQLDTVFLLHEPARQRHLLPQLIFTAALAAGTLNQAPAKNLSVEIVQTPRQSVSEDKTTDNSDSSKYIYGTIIDNLTKEKLQFINILIEGTHHGVTSDEQGNFKLPIPDSLVGKEITLIISSVGYKQKTLKVKSENVSTVAMIRLQKNEVIMVLTGDVIMVDTTKLNSKHSKKQKSKCK